MIRRACGGARDAVRTLGVAALLAVVSALLAPPAAADRRADLDALRRSIETSRERVAAYERRERGLLETLQQLDETAALISRDLEHARRSTRKAQAELKVAEGESAEIARRLAATQRAMGARAVALYRAGELGPVRLLFSSDGVREFLTRISALRLLLDHDTELVERHRTESVALAAAEDHARTTAQALAVARQRLEQRSAELVRERGDRRSLVTRLHDDRARERAALVELEKAAQALEETLANLGADPDAGGGALGGPPFASLRRRLWAPVDARIARGFGRVVDPEFLTETFQSGIVYEAPIGRPVRSVAAGRVRFAGWFRGYGKMVILDHGDTYFSVSGHLNDLEVAVGDRVGARQVIGSVGETGSLSGPRLYFEIRQGSQALDPRDWLRPALSR